MDDTLKDPETDDFLNQKSEANSFEANLQKIQEAAAELVRVQEVFKQQGKLTSEQRKAYTQSLEKLGLSAQKLAKIEGSDDDVRLLLEEPQGDRVKNKADKKKPENVKFPPYHKYNKKDEDCEEGAVQEEGDTTTQSSSSSSAANTENPTTEVLISTTTKKPKPPIIVQSGTSVSAGSNDQEEESSVAEAKPVGLAISGIGGVASSKPVGTAVVGPGGLAVARPVGTAIAGIKPSDFSALGLPLPTKLKNLSARDSASLPSKGKYGLVNFGTDDEQGQFLVGPEFLAEARLSEKGIDSNDGDFEYESDDKMESDDSKTVERESSKHPRVTQKDKDEVNELDSSKQTEQTDIPQFPFGIEYGKHPLFPPTYDNYFNYQNPYFLPPNAYSVPAPIFNQYLQRRSSNPILRYPAVIPQYPGFSNNALPISPFRVFYAQ